MNLLKQQMNEEIKRVINKYRALFDGAYSVLTTKQGI